MAILHLEGKEVSKEEDISLLESMIEKVEQRISGLVLFYKSGVASHDFVQNTIPLLENYCCALSQLYLTYAAAFFPDEMIQDYAFQAVEANPDLTVKRMFFFLDDFCIAPSKKTIAGVYWNDVILPPEGVQLAENILSSVKYCLEKENKTL